MQAQFSDRPLAMALAILLMGLAAPLNAQEATGSIVGEVTATLTLRPLAGVQVFIPGTGVGALTNTEGRFLLRNVPSGEHLLRAQAIGFGQSELRVTVSPGGTAAAAFQLTESAIALDEVVVTGAGQATERRRIGNTVGTIDASQLVDAPIMSASDVLQARTPGVTVGQGGGSAGEASSIRIRGAASLSQSNEPIIYIDGVRADGAFGFGNNSKSSRLDDLDPNSIERVEILKGAAAATLYGTEASNGVIQIFTKKGQSGAPVWSLETSGGWARLDASRYPDLAGFALAEGPSGTRDRGTRGIRDAWGIDVQPYEVFAVPMLPYLAETGRHHAHSLSVSGGTDLITYYVAGRYSWEDGIRGMRQFGPTRDLDYSTQLSANMSLTLTENLRMQVSTRYTDRFHNPNDDGSPSSPLSVSILAKPEFANEQNPLGRRTFGSIREAMLIEWSERTRRFGGALTTNYALTPELSFEVTSGVDVVSSLGSEFRPFGYNIDGIAAVTPDGFRQVQNRDHVELTLEGRSAWNTDLTERISSGLVVGAQLLTGETVSGFYSGERFPGPGLEVTGAGSIQRTSENLLRTVSAGVYAQEQLGFDDFVFVTLGARYDRHSAFGQDAGGALYPKVSFSVVPSSLAGWEGFGPVQSLRFRGAWGRSGLQPGAFDQFTTFGPVGSETGPGLIPSNLGNPDLKPEVSTEWEVGFEAGILDDRYALEFTYWDRTVNDLLIQRQFQPSGGFLAAQLDNIGELRAQGLEFGLRGSVYSRPRLSITAFANAAYLTEEVTDLGGAPPLKIGGTRQLGWVREGYAPGAYFGGKLVAADYPISIARNGQLSSMEEMLAYFAVPRTPEEVQERLLGERVDGDLLGHYLGKPIPDWTGAVGADVQFLTHFRLSTNVEFRGGNYTITDHTGGFRSSHPTLGRNTVESAQIESTLRNPASTAEQRLEAARRYAETGAALDQFNGLNQAFAGDFVRLRELSLTYSAPSTLAGRIGAESLSLTVGGRNLLLFTSYPGMDPENTTSTQSNITTGHDAHKLGIPRRLTFSARVGF
jgi:TonB-dependent starch-binding outer membrane protein SusC